jgi:hypothetical protein
MTARQARRLSRDAFKGPMIKPAILQAEVLSALYQGSREVISIVCQPITLHTGLAF